MNAPIVIVGASLGGLRVLESLIECGVEPESIVIIGAERFRPYNRPPLSKEVLASIAVDGIDKSFNNIRFKIKPQLESAKWLLGRQAKSVDLAQKCLKLDDGTEITYSALIVATGLSPRRLNIDGAWTQRHVLRTLDDSYNLSAAIHAKRDAVVVGGGFIGCEAAAAARKLGCNVVVVEPLAAPMERTIGYELGMAMRRLHEDSGVSFRTGANVTDWRIENETLTGVVLSTGETIAADFVVEAVGSVANIEWLEGTGLNIDNGLVCDNWMRIEGRKRLYAAGDIARFPNPRFDTVCRRIEHWCMPGFTGKRAAETCVADLTEETPPPEVFSPMPSFWSDQYDVRIQSFGLPSCGNAIEFLEGSIETASALRQGVAVGYRRDGVPIGVVCIGLPASKALAHRKFLDVQKQSRPSSEVAAS